MDVKYLFEAKKLAENMDTTTHVLKMEAHFCLMQARVDELAVIGDPISARTYLQKLHSNFLLNSITATIQIIGTTNTLNAGKTIAEDLLT